MAAALLSTTTTTNYRQTSPTNHRCSFLPDSIKVCKEKFSDSVKKNIRLDFNDLNCCGFDESGQYYSMLQRITGYYDSYNSVSYHQIASYWYEGNGLSKAFIKLDTGDVEGRVKKIFYDFYTNRWFVLTESYPRKTTRATLKGNSSDEQNGCLKFYSGSVRKKLTKDRLLIKVVKNEHFSFQLPLRAEFERLDAVYRFERTQEYGDVLVLLCHLNSRELIFNLIKYNDNEMSRLKVITVPSVCCRFVEAVFVDFKANHLFCMNKFEGCPMTGYNFSGERLFTHSLESESNYLVMDVLQVEGSVFLVNYIRCTTFKLIKINESAINVLGTFEYHIPTIEPGIPRWLSFQLIKTMGEHFLCAQSEELESHVIHVSLTNIRTGKLVLNYQTVSQESYSKTIFNWNLTELALSKRKSEKILVKFVKMAPFDLSLKHAARLACLKSFSEDYLNEQLPVCLRKYLGV